MKSLLRQYTVQPPKRTPKSQRFENESTLVNVFSKSIKLSDKGFIVFEFKTTNGITDVVLCKLRKDWRRYWKIGEIDPRWLYALIKLPYRKNFSTEEFSKVAGASKARSRVALNQYTNKGYCLSIGKGKWRKLYQPRPIVNRICSVEAKLSNWKRALTQAFNNYSYSNESWVLLDSNYAESALENLEKFKRLNVGFATVNGGGGVETHFIPKSITCKSKVGFWYANAKLAKFLRP